MRIVELKVVHNRLLFEIKLLFLLPFNLWIVKHKANFYVKEGFKSKG